MNDINNYTGLPEGMTRESANLGAADIINVLMAQLENSGGVVMDNILNYTGLPEVLPRDKCNLGISDIVNVLMAILATGGGGGGGGGVTSVNTRVGAIELTKSDVQLSNVNNTSDQNKPVSNAQATADSNVLSTAIQYTVDSIAFERGRANGLAPLNSNSRLPLANGSIVAAIVPSLSSIIANDGLQEIANKSEGRISNNENQISILTAASQKRAGAFANKTVVGVGSCAPYGGILSNGTTDVSETSKVSYLMIGNTSEASVYFTNFDSFQTATVTPYDDITLTASVEYPVGTLTKITFKNGDNSVFLRKGFGIASDFLKTFIPHNAQYWIRTCVTVSTGQKWLKNMVTSPAFYAYGQAYEGVTAGDSTMAGTIPSTNSYAYGPTAIFGVSSTTKGSIALYGNSLSCGVGDNNPFILRYNFAGGIYGRGFGFQYNTLSLNNPGCSLAVIQRNLSVNYKYYDELLSSVQLFISDLGVNDFSVTSAAVMQSYYINLWYTNYAHGIKGYQTTITPYNSSSDSWATLANQTVGSQDGTRTFINTWMRDGAPINYSTKVAAAVGTIGANIVRTGNILHPLRGIFDVAATVESSLNSGKWIVDGTANYATADGLHGTPNSYPLMTVPINVALFNL